MGRWTSLLSVAVLFYSASSLSAAPILITQTFGPALSALSVNGTSQTVTGDWIFKIQTDTTNPDFGSSGFAGRFDTSSIVVSNTGLGLSDVVVTSHQFYYETRSSIGNFTGIRKARGGSGTAMVGPSGSIGNPNIIESDRLDFTATSFKFFSFDSRNPLVLGDGTMIIGGPFMASGVQSSGPVVAAVDLVAQLITGSPSTLSQTVSTGAGVFPLGFDYLFQTLTGDLTVRLGGVDVGMISAPGSLQTSLQSASFLIDGAFLNQSGIDLEFILDGPTGSSLLLDNVVFPGLSNGDFQAGSLSPWATTSSPGGSVQIIPLQAVPEPSSLALLATGMMSLIGYGWRRKREQACVN